MRWLWCVLLLGCQGEKVAPSPADTGGAADDATFEASSDAAIEANDSTIDDATLDASTDSMVDSTMDSALDAPAESNADGVPPDAPMPDVVTDGALEPSDPQCGTHKAGPMVWSGMPANFCIDAREVSRGEYLAFVADPQKPASPGFCDWNTSFTPALSVLTDAHPITGIDFCDAVTFCEWAGKHLCGALADGKPVYDEKPSTSQWAYACVAGDITTTNLYGTGAAPAAGVCRVETSTPSEVVSHPTCVGPRAPWNRVRNLTGNVREWDAAGCNVVRLVPGTTEADRDTIDCAVRGGSYAQTLSDSRCVTSASKMIDQEDAHTGFRCCKGPLN